MKKQLNQIFGALILVCFLPSCSELSLRDPGKLNELKDAENAPKSDDEFLAKELQDQFEIKQDSLNPKLKTKNSSNGKAGEIEFRPGHQSGKIDSKTGTDKKLSNEKSLVPQNSDVKESDTKDSKTKNIDAKKVTDDVREQTNSIAVLSPPIRKVSGLKLPDPSVYKNNPKFRSWDASSILLWQQLDFKYLKSGQKFAMDISYMGLSAASLFVEIKPPVKFKNGRSGFHFYARAKTADYYSWIYELDDVVETFVDMKSYSPVKYSLTQVETKKRVDDLQLFDQQKMMTYFRYKKIKKGKESLKKEDKPIPYLTNDLFSSFFFFKCLPWKEGSVYTFPTTTKGKTWLMRVEIGGQEKIRVMNKEFLARKVIATTKYSGDLAKQGNIQLWLSDDENRHFLKFKSEVKIGSVRGEVKFLE